MGSVETESPATAQAASDGELPGAMGIVILSYPLHAPGRPSVVNARALEGLKQPILFVQGTLDPMADPKLIAALVEKMRWAQAQSPAPTSARWSRAPPSIASAA